MIETLFDWLRGDLSPAARVLTAAGPAVFIAAYFLLGLVAFAVRNRLRGPFQDADLASRGTTPILGMWLRLYFSWLMRPLMAAVVSIRIPPTAITTLSVLLGLGAGVAAAAGRMALSGWLFIGAGACD